MRVLYSFPHKLGAERICYTAWQQVRGIAAAGAEVTLFPGALSRPVPSGVDVHPTLAKGAVRIPYKLLGSMRASAIHDYLVSRRLKALAGSIDIIHTWPLGALRTLRAAAELGIPTVLERPNAHTRFAFEVVQRECQRLGVALPRRHDHAYRKDVLRIEEEEYQLAYRLLCPSDFVVKTFRDKGFHADQLARHIYGVDEHLYYPRLNDVGRERGPGLLMLFAGTCDVRKGVHYALDAWLRSPASQAGTFLIAGNFLPAYARALARALSHPSVKVLGHRNDLPSLMRQCDILVLSSIEEGSALVVTEAMASGCVPLASEASTDLCEHLVTGLVHRVGDVEELAGQITLLHEDRALLARLRQAALAKVPEITWTAAGRRLFSVYQDTIATYARNRSTDLEAAATVREKAPAR